MGLLALAPERRRTSLPPRDIEPTHTADYARRLALPILALVLLAGCRQSDSERLDRKQVEGQECIVVRDGMGRAKAIDCDWSQR